MYLFCFNLFVICNCIYICLFMCWLIFLIYIYTFLINIWDRIIESFQHWFMNKSFDWSNLLNTQYLHQYSNQP